MIAQGVATRTQVTLERQIFTGKIKSVTIRREMGRDIDGACGQLRRRHLEEK